ncbi:MAG: amidohydrolase [Bacteroidetes bacterium]|nr:amidohydrolase [Bacteroidota bacterium]
MRRRIKAVGSLLYLLLIAAVASRAQATLYKVNGVYGGGNSLVVQADTIAFVGRYAEAKKLYPQAPIEQRKKTWIYPGFMDAHAHFYYYGLGLTECDLRGTESFREVCDRVAIYARLNPEGWIIGRGWDQNDWNIKEFPDRYLLDSMFPERPVVLKRVDGHAILINDAARRATAFNPELAVNGGEIIKKDGRYTGVLIDQAGAAVSEDMPAPSRARQILALELAASNCLYQGVTAVSDAGLPYDIIYLIDSLQTAGRLPIRIDAMMAPEEANFRQFRMGGFSSPWLAAGSMKYYLDGALGSRGACLKEDYCDRKGHRGLLLIRPDSFETACQRAAELGIRICVHAIGDSANKLALYNMTKYMPQGGRWRVEHAQVVDPHDIVLFRNTGIIPSVQPTHATSDAPWAESRLCNHRMSGAYAYKTLLNTAGTIALGTDFPVEQVNPFATYLAAVYRNSADGSVKHFRSEEALSPETCIKGMTEWAWKASDLKARGGKIAPGYQADLIFLNRDLIRLKENEVLHTQVLDAMTAGVIRTIHVEEIKAPAGKSR